MKAKLTVIIALIFLALSLRVYKLGAYGLWSDEICSINSAIGIKDPRSSFMALPDDDLNLHKDLFTPADYWNKFNLRNTVNATIRDNGANSLAYTVMLHYWLLLFGVSEYALRVSSVIFGLLLVLAGYYFSKKMFNSDKISVITAILLTIHPLLIVYSREIRGYSLAIFASFISSYAAFKIINHKSPKGPSLWLYAAYISSALISLFSHFLTLYILAAHAIFFLIFIRGKRARNFIYAMAILVFLFFSIWFLLGLQRSLPITKNFHREILKVCGPGARTNFFTLAAGWAQSLIAIFGNYFQWFGFRIRQLAPTLLIPLAIIAVCRRKMLENFGYKHIIFLALLIIFAPIFATVASLRAGHILAFMPRYCTFSIPYAVILLAICADCSFQMPRPKKAIVLFLLGFQIVIMLVSLKIIYADIFNVYLSGGRQPRKPNPYIELANKIVNEYKNGDIVVYPRWEDAQLTNLYLRGCGYILQKVDKTHPDEVILIKGKGNEKIELFSFEKGKPRY